MLFSTPPHFIFSSRGWLFEKKISVLIDKRMAKLHTKEENYILNL